MVAPRKIGDFVWELPVGLVPGMRVPGRVFASDALMQKAIEDKAVQQVANVATLPGIVTASLAMPDIHWGYGFPIGGVAATDVDRGGVISPGGVGFDIGCGVRLLRSDLVYDTEVKPRLRELVDTLGERVPRGVGGRGRMPLRASSLDQVLREGARFAVARGAGWEEDLESCESRGTLPGAEPDFISPRAKERGAPQLGSLGAGNHFLEVQVVDAIRDSDAAAAMELFQGQVCVMIHSGSRGIGHQTCTDHLRVIDRLQAKLGYALPDRQLACVPFEHAVARSYVGAMSAAGNFALANRQVLADAVRESCASLFGRSSQALGLRLVYDVAHNLAKIEEYVVDGRPRRLCVHRKGATRAFGPGHAELPPRYAPIGQPVIIPGSMGTASFVLAGTAQARDLSFSSTCHGAGRAMSRTKAKQVMSGQALRQKLEEEGILLARSHWALLSEEAPYAYKSAADVVETCEGVGLSRVVARLRPVAVVKG
ncbi:MAG: RNA-splicing ligase RtcB [Luteitalea sp.]|nr:RNA-splicing ligase RtcB [Luteitalea sp.]